MRGEQEKLAVSAESGRWAWLPERGLPRTIFEVLIIVPAYVLYQLVRGTVDGRTGEAFQRAYTIVDVEQTLGIFWEYELQSLIITWDLGARIANTIYVWGHLPLIIVIAFWLLAFHRHRYALFRNAFLISGAIALFFFWLFPTAPPRFLQYWGFVDTAVSSGSQSYYWFQPPAFVNQYAAMPSLHFGWSLLAAVAVYVNLRPPYRYVALIMPFLTLGGIVLTGNHFFLDAAAGGAVALTGLGIALLLRAYLPREKPFTVLA
jgi:hypothetical protein